MLAPSPSSRLHILVVDDDPAVREAVGLALRDTYVVHAAATGPEACGILPHEPTAVIVLDAVLADEDGLDLIEPFRKLTSARILILTGNSSEALAIRALQARADDYMKKPVSLHELRARIARLLPDRCSSSDPVDMARRLVEEHLEKEIDPAQLAGQVGMTEAHLRRCFRERYGVTPRRYHTERRLERVADLLRTTDQSIEQAALAVGLANLRWLRRLFRRRFGMNPGDYRITRLPMETTLSFWPYFVFASAVVGSG